VGPTRSSDLLVMVVLEPSRQPPGALQSCSSWDGMGCHQPEVKRGNGTHDTRDGGAGCSGGEPDHRSVVL
jgi:hypothetical protein